MRIGNRIDTVITGARMKRIAKTRAFTTKYKTTGSRATGSAKSTGVVSKSSNNVLLELLNRINKSDTSMTGEKLAENQSKSYDYDMIRLSAERVGAHMDQLLKTEEDSLYAKEEESKDRAELAREISGFVSDYNIMMRKLSASEESADKAYVRKLKSEVSTYEAALKELGITQDSKGALSLDLQTLTEAELSGIQKVFGAEDGFSGKIKALSKEVGTHAQTQIDKLQKESYSLSTNYSRYGTDAGYYGTAGSSYNAKG